MNCALLKWGFFYMYTAKLAILYSEKAIVNSCIDNIDNPH